MSTPKTGKREQWLKARLKLLKEEKELTHRSDELARKRLLHSLLPLDARQPPPVAAIGRHPDRCDHQRDESGDGWSRISRRRRQSEGVCSAVGHCLNVKPGTLRARCTSRAQNGAYLVRSWGEFLVLWCPSEYLVVH